MHKHAFASDRREQSNLRRADDRARTHRDITGLDIITCATNVGP